VAKLLIVDDDVDFAHHLGDLLKPHSWSIETATSGKDALQLLQNFKYDFILLDWNLPDATGLEICSKFRATGADTPIIFLTGRQTVADKEAGLDAGADDYLTKPFEERELLARIRAVQRRRGKPQGNKRTLRNITLDSRLRRVFIDGKETQLSQKECSILEFLMDNPNNYYSSSQILEAVWPTESEASEEAVRVHMKALRRKLAEAGCDNLIRTVIGAGYVIEDPVR
jgi:DNA-binding response OmpR family regulator